MKQMLYILSSLSLLLFIVIFPERAFATTCGANLTGDYATSTDGSCSFSGDINGVDNVLTITAGTTLTIQPNQTIGATSIVIQTGGTVILPASGLGSLKPGTKVWYVDADEDHYPASTTPKVQSTSPGINWVQRNTLTATTTDCYDQNLNPTDITNGAAVKVHPGQTTYYTAAYNTNQWDYNCDNTTSFVNQSCLCGTCGNGCSSSPSCTPHYDATITPTSNTNGTYTCGVAMTPGPGSCTRKNDGYGTCTECNNGTDGSYTVGCL
jgi:hypothetical protein